jgi:hypothetical protein
METPFETAQRLLSALDELVMQETMLIRTMDFVEAVEVRERAAPLVIRLCGLAGDSDITALRPRVDALLDRCSQNYHFLDTQLQRLQSELDRVNTARGRLRKVAPAYRSEAPSESRLNTAA